MIRLSGALLSCSLMLLPQGATDEDVLRGLVAQYYQAQTAKDADTAAAFWSPSVTPRMSRDSYLAVFSAGDAEYIPEIQSLTISGTEARVRVSVAVARAILRNDVPGIVRQTLSNALLWRREGATWKLAREGPFAEDFADQLLAASPGERGRLLTDNQPELSSSLRYVLAQRGGMLAGQMRYAQAGEIFDLALLVARAAKDRRAESETLQNLANGYYFQATRPGASAAAELFTKAADYYGQRLALAHEMADQEAIAASLTGMATVSYSRGEYTPAVGYYREALVIYERRDDGASIGRTLVSIGNVQFLQADYDEATASYRRGLALLIAGLDPQGATFARGGLARVFGAQGDLAAALDMHGQVLADTRAAAALDPRMKTNAVAPLESIGDIHFRLGNTDQARAAFDEARRLADGVPEMAGRVYGELGLTEIVAGRFDAALANYTESRRRYETAGNPSGVAQAWTGIGFSHAAREKYADAIPAYRTAIRLFESQKAHESAGRAWLGLSIAQSGALEHLPALESAEKVGVIATIVESEDLAWRAAVRVGDVLRKLSRADEARQSFQRAITAIDRVAADAPVNPEARRQLDDSASAWTGLALTLAGQGDAPGALAAVEARRAHIRRVQISGFQRDITRGTTAEERAEEQGIVRELMSARAQLGAERTAAKPEAVRLARLQDQLATLGAKRRDQQERLYARLPELRQWRGLEPIASDLVTRVAPDTGTLLLQYLVADEEVLAITVAPGAPSPAIAATLIPFKRRELAAAIDGAMQGAVLKDAGEWRVKAAPVSTILLDPIASHLRDRARIVIVPDDLLWRVPFEALPAGGADLAAQALVTYATSLATLAAQRAIVTSSGDTPVAGGIAGAPAIPLAIRAQVALTQPSWKEPDADRSRAAALEIARPYGNRGTVRIAQDATEGAMRALLETSDVVQVLAPLQVSGPTPLFSAMLVGSGGAAPGDEGRWEAREWFNVNGRARVLVVPDASTLGAAGASGAMDVMAWAAAAANVPCLVIGRWPADGFTPDAFLASLHAQLAAGLPAGAAWRAATLSARERSGGAPSGWAGLRLLGADRR